MMKNGWVGWLTAGLQGVGAVGAFLFAYQWLDTSNAFIWVFGLLFCIWQMVPYVAAAVFALIFPLPFVARSLYFIGVSLCAILLWRGYILANIPSQSDPLLLIFLPFLHGVLLLTVGGFALLAQRRRWKASALVLIGFVTLGTFLGLTTEFETEYYRYVEMARSSDRSQMEQAMNYLTHDLPQKTRLLSNVSIHQLLEALAQNPGAPPDMLKALAVRPEGRVRYLVAVHPQTPVDVLTQLSVDKDQYVRQAVAQRLRAVRLQ